MAWSTAGRNVRADLVAGVIAKVSLHTADPDPSEGASFEWSGGGYVRQSPSFSAAVGGVASLSSELVFAGPALEDAAFVGLWDSSNVFLGGAPRTSGDAASNAAGQYNISVLNINAEGKITA